MRPAVSKSGIGRVGSSLALACALLSWSAVGQAQEPAQASASARHSEPPRTLLLAQAGAKKAKGKAKKGAAAKGETAPAAKPAEGSGDAGGLKFSKDIAPILVANCVRCHDAKDPQFARRKHFDMTSFQALMKGGDDGKVIEPGKPDESTLLLRVKGEETPKMPPGNNRLSEEAIAKIEAWVKAGARLDAGIDPAASLRTVAPSAEDLRRAELAKLSPAERDGKLEAVAKERLKQAGVKGELEMTPSTTFLLFHKLPKDRATHTLKTLETQAAALNRLLAKSANEPLFSPLEKVSIYVFNEPGQFAEFARAVEQREVESTDQAHGNLGGEAPYLVVIDPLAGREDESLKKRATKSKKGGDDGPERSLVGLLSEQLGTAAAIQAGKPPRWLSLGLGAYLGSQVEPRSPYYRGLRELTLREYKLGWETKAQEVLGDGTDAERLRAVGFSLVEWLATTDRARFTPFIRGMLSGAEKLDEGIKTLWNADRASFLNEWGGWVAARYGRGR